MVTEALIILMFAQGYTCEVKAKPSLVGYSATATMSYSLQGGIDLRNPKTKRKIQAVNVMPMLTWVPNNGLIRKLDDATLIDLCWEGVGEPTPLVSRTVK